MDLSNIYVYPNGGCASVALRILRDLTSINEVRFIDDSNDKTSLKTLKQEILDLKLPVLLLGGDCYSTLEEKCKKEGIEYINGIALCAKLLSTSLVAGGGRNLH